MSFNTGQHVMCIVDFSVANSFDTHTDVPMGLIRPSSFPKKYEELVVDDTIPGYVRFFMYDQNGDATHWAERGFVPLDDIDKEIFELMEEPELA